MRPLGAALLARVAKLVDAADLKSAALKGAYGFKSRPGHQYLQGHGVALFMLLQSDAPVAAKFTLHVR